ncbi:MAG: c-type cytochrome [Deltaproteobacteria bacterium]|nr:c-type cytochrome [Deltaproteobacteria bacterium]
MKRLSNLIATLALLALLGWAGASAARAEPQPRRANQGNATVLYNRYCLACHGERGDGQGPAAPWLYPKPRDFTTGRAKWRTTPSGLPPTGEDLGRVIREGAPGTSMPAFEGILDPNDIAELVAFIKSLGPMHDAGQPVKVPDPPHDVQALAARGRELYAKVGCALCHGDEGRGNGPLAAHLKNDQGRPNPPLDFTTSPLRRGRRGIRDIFLTLSTGLDGTPMPSFSALPEMDLFALAAHVDSIRWKGDSPTRDPTSVPPPALNEDGRETPVGLKIPAQGAPPASLPPAATSLSSAQCGRCHEKQLREWQETLHAGATSPGLLGQLIAGKPSLIASCQSCHAPLAEQQPPSGNHDLRLEGVTCAACHVRGHVRHGPPRREGSALLAIPSYPLVEDPAYERSDFCLPCHQLPAGLAVSGRPLLNTYREWLEGPYMRRGVQCQHCHMPDREHRWKGVHDPDTVRQATLLEASARREDGGVAARVRLTNIGAGHYFPTTPTPAISIEVALVAKGRVIDSTRKRIGRWIEWRESWKEIEDTRIPPGQAVELTPRFEGPLASSATSVRVIVTVAPDDYYAGLYRSLLGKKLAESARKELTSALARAEASRYVLVRREIEIPSE